VDWVSAITAQQATQKICVPKLTAGLDNKGEKSEWMSSGGKSPNNDRDSPIGVTL
jgi:hypothetical protein